MYEGEHQQSNVHEVVQPIDSKTEIFPPKPVRGSDIEKIVSQSDKTFWEKAKRARINGTEALRAFLAEQFHADREKGWKNAPEKIAKNNVVCCLVEGGLGDQIYSILDAVAVARAYPEKTVVANVELYDFLIDRVTLSRELPNLKLVVSKDEIVQHLDKNGKNVYIQFYDLGGYDSFRNKVVKMEEKLSPGYVEPPRPKRGEKLRSLLAQAFPQRFARKTKGQELEDRILSTRQNDSDLGSTFQMRMSLGTSPFKEHLEEKVRKREKKIVESENEGLGLPIFGRYPIGFTNADNQLLVGAARLRYLLGIKEHLGDYVDKLPFVFPETEPKKYDYVFVYDAAANPMKVIHEEKLKSFLNKIYAKNPHARVGIVLGKTNRDIGENVLIAFPNLQKIEGDIKTVLGEVMKSNKLISADTMWPHVINFAHHAADRNPNLRPPELTVLMSLDVTFSPGFYAADRAEGIVLVDGSLDELDEDKVLSM